MQLVLKINYSIFLFHLLHFHFLSLVVDVAPRVIDVAPRIVDVARLLILRKNKKNIHNKLYIITIKFVF